MFILTQKSPSQCKVRDSLVFYSAQRFPHLIQHLDSSVSIRLNSCVMIIYSSIISTDIELIFYYLHSSRIFTYSFSQVKS